MPAAPPILGSTGSTTFALVVALVALGIAMLGAGFWLVRATRTDKPALGPLEVMGDRRFKRRAADEREVVLAGARPDGALGPAPMVEIVDDTAAASVEPDGEAPAPDEPAPDEAVPGAPAEDTAPAEATPQAS